MQETQVRSLGQEDPLEKEMATHSSILAWRIPWTEKPGGVGLQFMGSQRVGHDLPTEHVRKHHLAQPFHLTYRAKTGASDPKSRVFVAEPVVALEGDLQRCEVPREEDP